MITKVVYDVSGAEHEIDWHWHHESGDWWPEIELVDDKTPDLTDEQKAVIQEALADDYPLWQYQDDRSGDEL